MMRAIWTVGVVAMLLAVTPALAQEREEGPAETKGTNECARELDGNFESLGANVSLEVTAEGDGGNLVALVTTASSRFETAVERLDKRWLNVDGLVTKDKGGKGYLVSYNIHVSRQVKDMDGWKNVSFYVKGSVLLKNGDKRVLGKSGDYTVAIKLKD